MRALLLVAVIALPLAARADDKPAKCMLRVIHALKDGEGIDPKIDKLRGSLQKDQFRAWKKFVLLDEKEATVQPKGTAAFDLPNGRKAELTFLQHIEGDKLHRMRIQFAIKPLLNTTLMLNEGAPVLLAGQPHGNGILILGVSCTSEK
jgi:hypothetical protein